jgi:hypothetical protein
MSRFGCPLACKVEELNPAAWLLAILTAGCAAGAEPPLTKFEALSNDEFTFEARAGVEYPEDDAEAEATRMDWLEQALADRGMCPDGYEITEKTVVAAEAEALGQTHNVAYHGVCK